MNIRMNLIMGMIMLLPGILQAEMPIFMMNDQNSRQMAVVPTKEKSATWSKTDYAIAAATAAGVYQYGKKAGHQEVMDELEIVKGQNKFTHAQIEGIFRKLNSHGISLDDIKKKQADHSFDLNKIRQTVERIEPAVENASKKLDTLDSKATGIERQATEANGKLDKLQGTVNAHRVGQTRQHQATQGMLRGLARILGVMHEESRTDSRQILTALGERMAQSKILRALLR